MLQIQKQKKLKNGHSNNYFNLREKYKLLRST